MSSAVGEVSTMAQGELARVCGSAGTSLGCGYLLGGQIDLAVETCSILLPQLRDGKLRPLGTPSPKRLDALPDVPTMAENGVPGFTASSWTGIVAPPGTPKPIIDKLNRPTNAAL